MRKTTFGIIVCIGLLFILLAGIPVYSGESKKTCLDSNTLEISRNQTLTIDGTAQIIEILEDVNCPGGCVNGECKPIQSSMPIEIYIFLCITAISMMFISFFKNDVIIIKWLSVIIFLMLGAASFNLNRIYCEHSSAGWDCFVHKYTGTNLAYLWFGLGAVMFIYAFISSVTKPAQEIVRQIE